MKSTTFLPMLLLFSVALGSAGCASLNAQSERGYKVGAGSAMYAGRAIPTSLAKTDMDLYFGHHKVRQGGDGRGCCYSIGMAGNDSKRPRGAVLAIWGGTEYGTDKIYSERFGSWRPKPLVDQYYYAVAQPSQLSPYPKRVPQHRIFGIYVSGGRVLVSEKGLHPDNASDAVAISSDDGKGVQYVFGRDDTLYYKMVSYGKGGEKILDEPSPWHGIKGVAITEEQYYELSSCSPGRECRWRLSPTDPDLTPEQRDYVERNPITPEDVKPLIRRSERSIRWQQRWA